MGAGADAPRPPDSLDPRTRRMRDLYASGATLQEVGERFGLTRERVRQLFRAHDIPIRTAKETAALRREHLLARHGERIRAAYVPGAELGALARRLDLSRELVAAALGTHPPYLAQRRAGRAPLYTDAELLDFLRRAGEGRSLPLTASAYSAYARDRRTADGRPWPTHQTPAKRFGGWLKACERAGLESNPKVLAKR